MHVIFSIKSDIGESDELMALEAPKIWSSIITLVTFIQLLSSHGAKSRQGPGIEMGPSVKVRLRKEIIILGNVVICFLALLQWRSEASTNRMFCFANSGPLLSPYNSSSI